MVDQRHKVDFFIVGAARSGTTSLYQYLSQHPDVFLPKVKELNYFSQVTSSEPKDYENPKPGREYHTKIIQSPEVYTGLFSGATPNQISGDISPSYLWHPETAKALYKHNPEAKIIVTLRHPVQRAFSHYLMAKSVGYDRSPNFEQAIKAPLSKHWGGGNRYLEWSDYLAPMQAYFHCFPKAQIHVMIFEQWIGHQEQAMADLANFLGIEHQSTIALGDQHNQTIAYKHQGVLNALRLPWARTLLHRLLSESQRTRLKGALFGAHAADEILADELKESLMQDQRQNIEQLEALTGQPLPVIWGLKPS